MKWNWQLAGWPKFRYDPESIAEAERRFLLDFGSSHASLKNVEEKEYKQFIVEILSQEGQESSKIEGEILDRESLQSSIKKHFGLKNSHKERKKEAGMAELLCSVYETFDKPLTHKMLWHWHSLLFNEESSIEDRGRYRSHKEPMQIVSSRMSRQRVFFEAPPSAKVREEMNRFIEWFNSSSKEPLLGRAAIAHLSFENIHPFEDGNGRIGRALVEKFLSKSLGQPTLIAVSKVLEARKKEYYKALGMCNRSLDAKAWVEFFASVVLQAQKDSMSLLHFLLKKSKMLSTLSGQLNPRQEKALLRMFAVGPSGFKGGLSAEKYIAITKASRATATRDLADLLEMGALKKTGELRHTRYWLKLTKS